MICYYSPAFIREDQSRTIFLFLLTWHIFFLQKLAYSRKILYLCLIFSKLLSKSISLIIIHLISPRKLRQNHIWNRAKQIIAESNKPLSLVQIAKRLNRESAPNYYITFEHCYKRVLAKLKSGDLSYHPGMAMFERQILDIARRVKQLKDSSGLSTSKALEKVIFEEPAQSFYLKTSSILWILNQQ